MLKLKPLSKKQKAIVEQSDESQLIIGGTGTGKTTVLTYKIAQLIENGEEPSSILSLHFSLQAAKKTREKVRELIGSKADYVKMGTFHSIFSDILRKEAESIGFTEHYSIYDYEDSTCLVDNIISYAKYNLDHLNPDEIRKKIKYLKNRLIFPAEFKKKYKNKVYNEDFVRVYSEYQSKLAENDAMDYEDILIHTSKLFEDKKTLTSYRKKFNYFLVDDIQDINISAYSILADLVSRGKRIFAAADDDQSILGIEGAELNRLKSFSKDFPKVSEVKLEESFRNSGTILNAAQDVIQNNNRLYKKDLKSKQEKGEKIGLIRCSDEKDEAYQIARFIKDEVKKRKNSMNDYAVIYRTSAQCRAYEDVFNIEKVPFQIIGSADFYRQKEVKDILAYLRIIVNERDEESLLRIMNFPQRGIGMTTIKRMIGFSRKNNITLFETMTRVFEVIDIKERIQKNVKNFKLLLDKYISLKEKLSVEELTRALIDELGIIRLFKEEHSLESITKLENLEKLLNQITEYSKNHPKSTLEDFLMEVALTSDLEFMDESKTEVKIMTLPNAKGLDYQVVFAAGLEEEMFPISDKFLETAELEEERRMFYMVITRAEEKLYLSHARSRYRFGEVAYQSRSRFIDEINQDLLEEVDVGANRKANRKTKKELYLEYFENLDYEDITKTNNKLKVGSRVMHNKFGLGKVVQIIGSAENTKASVVFEGNNVKQLMLKFAKLKVLP